MRRLQNGAAPNDMPKRAQLGTWKSTARAKKEAASPAQFPTVEHLFVLDEVWPEVWVFVFVLRGAT
jgi:hypothetical protein